MFRCTLIYVHSSIAIILMGKRELFALLNLLSWCLVMVEWLFLAVPSVCLRFVIVVFPDHTHLPFLVYERCRNLGSRLQCLPPIANTRLDLDMRFIWMMYMSVISKAIKLLFILFRNACCLVNMEISNKRQEVQ